MWTQGFCPTLDGVRRPYGRTLPGMSVLQIRFPEEMKESLVQAPTGAQQHRQLLLRHQEAGAVGQATLAWTQGVLAGESRGQPLVGTTKSSQMEEVGRVAGKMDPAIKVATLTPGVTTLTKMTDPIPGLMALNHSRDGVPMVEM